jgi:DNA-binding transcriptional ArsR family regulator
MTAAPDVTMIMKTLADPTRRAVYETITRSGETTVGALTKGSHVSQPAISQHVRALREAGLVAERRAGRQVFYRAEPGALAPLIGWIGFYSRFWRERFDNIEQLLKEIEP